MKSIGQILKAARQKKNYTIDDIHRLIKIHKRYIKALENDDYSIFDGKVHAKGFLKIYTEFLELETGEIMALWRREYEPAFEDQPTEKYHKIKTLEPEKFSITPAMLIGGFVTLLLLGFFVYLYFQYRQYTDAPNLDIYYPQDNQVVKDDVLDITGKADLDSEVFINNQKIIANPDGSFLTSIKLREGINTISIKAVNKLNKETERVLNIIYRLEETTPAVTDEVKEEVPETTPSEQTLPTDGT
jgi:cytoskeletal protein RodZ